MFANAIAAFCISSKLARPGEQKKPILQRQLIRSLSFVYRS